MNVQNKVVARFMDGRVVKGTTVDFLPTRPSFHLLPIGQTGTTIAVIEIQVSDLKALFFVKDFIGDATYDEAKAFNEGTPTHGRRMQVVFRDDEMLVGTTTGYQPERSGFFLVPADPRSNNDRCFIVAAAVKGVKFL